MKENKALLFYLSIFVFLFHSCSSTKYLKGGEFLLKSNSVKLSANEKIENKRTLKYELSTLYKQKVNGKFFFVPREWFYYKTQPPRDKKRFYKWLRRVIAEPPTLFSEELAEETREAIELYLKYKGYYDAEVFYEDNIRGEHKVDVTYFVDAKKRYLIDSVAFASPDSTINIILQRISNDSYFELEEGLDGNLYELEKKRITEYLRNNGYAFFFPNYFPPMEVDTTEKAYRAQIRMEVSPPFNDSLHRVYTVGKIEVFPNFSFDLLDSLPLIDTEVASGIVFRDTTDKFRVNPRTILNAISMVPGKKFNQSDYDRTNEQLGNLGIFRFVRIRQFVDSIQPYRINFRIELTKNKLNELGMDFELNYTNRSNTSGVGNLIGIAVSPSWRNRNFFKGAETFISNFSAGIEINPNPEGRQRFTNTIDLGVQTDLFLPDFYDYLGFWKLVDKLTPGRKVGGSSLERFYDQLSNRSATRITTSYNHVDLLNFYKYNLLAASFGYDFRKGNRRYIINNLAIDYFDPITRDTFQMLLNANPFLERSFGNQLFVSLLFREFNYVYNSRINSLGESNYVGLNFEVAGTEVWAGNALYNALSQKRDTFKIGNADFSQYLRLEADFRYSRQFNPKNAFAGRISLGIVRPFGYTRDVPYVKQFYVGGPNSIRAWPARNLGPGGFIDSLSLETNNPLLFYQTGDLRFEFNAEYRFNIFWLLNGAIFLDGGNIWTFKEDESRPNAQFLLKSKSIIGQDGLEMPADPFYKQIGLGTGFGFRIDLSYFLFRLDFGLRLRYPYKWKNDSYWVAPSDWFEDVNINFGLGYPF